MPPIGSFSFLSHAAEFLTIPGLALPLNRNIVKMKVTLSFNGTKIVVPCGAGDISVRELTGQAVSRYKRAIGKHVATGAVSDQDYWVSVHSLRYFLFLSSSVTEQKFHFINSKNL